MPHTHSSSDQVLGLSLSLSDCDGLLHVFSLWPSVIRLSSRASSQTAIPSILSNNAWILHASEQTAPGLRVVNLRRPERV
jgi:hypothetical protein